MMKCIRLTDRRKGTGRPATSRSGGMLILVLVIMAVGLILITSALSVTIATRNRFYDDAQTSQARLTLTSTAKTVVDAITVTQELRDSLIESWADAGEVVWFQSASGYGFTEGVGTSNSVAPGIGAKSEAAGGWTKATFGRSGDYITIDFATGINATGDGVSENVRVLLEIIPPVAFPTGFGSMFTLGGANSTNTINNTIIGTTTGYDPSQILSNYVVLNGNLNVGTGTIDLVGDVVYTGMVLSGAGNAYKGNIVFWGDDAGIYTNLGGNGVITSQHILFLGKTPGVASVFLDAAGNPTTLTSSPAGGVKGTKGQYYVNTTMKKDTWGQYILGEPFYIDSGVVFYDYTDWFKDPYNNGVMHNMNGALRYTPEGTDLAGNIVAGPTHTAAYNASTIKPVVLSYTTDLDKIANIERKLPTSSEAKALAQYDTVAEITAGATKITSLTTNQTFTGSSYYIDASTGNQITGNLIFDLVNNDITLYVINSSSAKPLYVGPESSATGSIQFINGAAHWGKIILLENGYMVAGKNNYSTWKGIISTTHPAVKTQATPGTKPCLYIIGFGNNTLVGQQFAIIDAYIGLYGSNGRFWADNGPIIYGRIESEFFDSNNSFFYLNYCPAPNDPAGGSAAVPLSTKYRVAAYVYS